MKRKARAINPEREAAKIKALVLLQNDFNQRHGIPLITDEERKRRWGF